MVKASSAFKAIGPGLLYAGAAIGVSHLVQSTRAGADYGWGLWWAIVLAIAAKYSFHEFGPRFAAATGTSLLDGYRRLGRWSLGIYVLVTLGTVFTIQAVVTLTTGGLLGHLMHSFFGVVLAEDATHNAFYWSLVTLAACWVVLLGGRYGLLDSLVKVIILLLTLSTLVAVVAAVAGTPAAASGAEAASSPSPWFTLAPLAFLVALMGWMPTPIDVSVWHSIWTLNRRDQTGHAPSVAEARLDFNIGYLGAGVIALLFLALGALVLRGGEEMPGQAVAFSARLIEGYRAALGDWIVPFITLAAFTAMFSTTITVTDAYPRVWRHLAHMARPTLISQRGLPGYALGLLLTCGGAIALLAVTTFGDQPAVFRTTVDVATALSFLAAPILGYINFRLIRSSHTPEDARPGKAMCIYSWVSLAVLVALSLLYIQTLVW